MGMRSCENFPRFQVYDGDFLSGKPIHTAYLPSKQMTSKFDRIIWNEDILYMNAEEVFYTVSQPYNDHHIKRVSSEFDPEFFIDRQPSDLKRSSK